MAISAAGKYAREYAVKHPSAATRTLARMLLRDKSAAFTSFEHARTMVRAARGENGKEVRSRKSPRVPTTKAIRFAMPESDAEPVQPFAVDLIGKGLIASDIHLPYHDRKACEVVFNHAIDKGHTDWLLLNGDILDCYQLSCWEKDPTKRHFPGELTIARQFLSSVCSVFDRVLMKLGNHEVRYERYLRQKSPELIGIKEFHLSRLLSQWEDDDKTPHKLDIDFIEENRVVHVQNLNILHGHEYKFSISNPVNPARGLFLRAKASAICGHFHQSSHHQESDVRGRPTSCWSTGCLCELHPEYAPLNKWNHGAALLDVKEKSFHVDNFRIIDGMPL